MLSRPDFEQKQIVVITSDDFKSLSLKNGNILITREDEIVHQISSAKIFCIFILGDVTITTKIVEELLGYQIRLYFLSMFAKPKFVIGNVLEGNYLLRQKQYANPYELQISIHIISNKLKNQLTLLKSLRNKSESCKQSTKKLSTLLQKVSTVESQDSLRGVEGNAAKLFFSSYFEEQKRYKRMPRTRADILNFLMDMGYSLLYCMVESHLSLYGFDIYKGVYHTLFYERKSLVCDCVEPFRCLIDEQIKKMYNLGQINEKDFRFVKGEYQLARDKRNHYIKLLLDPIIERKKDFFLYHKGLYSAMMSGDMAKLPEFIL